MAKIMISSTSEDLAEHRARVSATLQRLAQQTIGMEVFGAEPDSPVDVCKRKVDEADLVVLIVAHRYGWVPRPEDGGDGVRSITRMEFDRAKRPSAGGRPKPVLAFLVDPKAPWTTAKEQDRLVQAKSEEEALDVYHAVRELGRFKAEIGGLVRDIFDSPSDLSDKVGTAVSNWLLKQKEATKSDSEAKQLLADLFERVDAALENEQPELALVQLHNALGSAPQQNLAAIADKRFRIAAVHLNKLDERLLAAASDVLAHGGSRRREALTALGAYKSQRARELWKSGQKKEAFALGLEARSHLEEAAQEDALNPDTWGTLGGVLKRLGQWAASEAPEKVEELEDAMLAAYKAGWETVPDAYPLLNYIEERARVAERRSPTAGGRALIGDDERALRDALHRALKTREKQLANRKDTPWAAFDLARGRHYLRPNLPAFLEDLQAAAEDARLVAQSPDDRYMVTTTCDSLRSLQAAHANVDGLSEGIALLERSIAADDWPTHPGERPAAYLETELERLRRQVAAVARAVEGQALETSPYSTELREFIHATALRWTRADEERFQVYLEQWKRDIEPNALKFARALWKIFGAKAAEALTGPLPLDWEAAAEAAASLLKK